MTTIAWALASVFAAAAVVDWWARWVGRRYVESRAKPLALVALIGVALTIDPVEPAVRPWFVVALACCLAGDVLLLDDRRFTAGLAAFLLAHVAYTVGFVVANEWSGRQFATGAVLMLVVGARVGGRIVRAADRESPALGWAVIAYLIAISCMFAAAAATGNRWAIAGGGLFVLSDAVLGWRRFVTTRAWMPVTIMVIYHLGQAGLVASLVAS